MELWIYTKMKYLQIYGTVDIYKDKIFEDIWICRERVKEASWQAVFTDHP